jgi:hypothetical protein
MTKKLALALCLLCFCCGAALGQTVEKLSVSFTFPTSVGSLPSSNIPMTGPSFFHATSLADHGSIVLEWSVPQSARKGSIALYTISGALVKKIDVAQNHGKLSLARELPAAGVFLATLSFGSYKQTLKLALYR